MLPPTSVQLVGTSFTKIQTHIGPSVNSNSIKSVNSAANRSIFKLTGYRIQQDIKNGRIETTRPVEGNIEGYKEPVDVTLYTPNRIKRTDQYEARRDRCYKWRELKSE